MKDLVSLKSTSLLLLACQNFLYGLLLPLSRKADANGHVYFAPTAVITTELFKILIALCAVVWEARERIRANEQYSELPKEEDIDDSKEGADSNVESLGAIGLPSNLRSHEGNWWQSIREEFSLGRNLRLLFPAILFVIQNNLQILSASYLDATEFQVLSQLKLFTAAIFSVLILKKKLVAQHWASIVILILGICIVQQASKLSKIGEISQSRLPTQDFMKGAAAMFSACIFSGVASISMEYLLKSGSDFWVANFLLASYSLLPAFIPVFIYSIAHTAFHPYRYFSPSVWAAVTLNALGGILVSMVMKHADNILKGFAVAAALLGTVIFNTMHSEQPTSWLRLSGAVIVVISMTLYAKAKVGEPALNMSDAQKGDVHETISHLKTAN